MLKITTRLETGIMIFALEGRLAGPWVKEAEQCWRSVTDTRQGYPVQVDLSAVTFIGPEGKDLLRQMYCEGAKLTASGCLNKCIVEGIMQSEPTQEKRHDSTMGECKGNS